MPSRPEQGQLRHLHLTMPVFNPLTWGPTAPHENYSLKIQACFCESQLPLCRTWRRYCATCMPQSRDLWRLCTVHRHEAALAGTRTASSTLAVWYVRPNSEMPPASVNCHDMLITARCHVMRCTESLLYAINMACDVAWPCRDRDKCCGRPGQRVEGATKWGAK